MPTHLILWLLPNMGLCFAA